MNVNVLFATHVFLIVGVSFVPTLRYNLLKQHISINTNTRQHTTIIAFMRLDFI